MEPINGLANRMGFLDSALALSEATGSRLFVLWFGDPTLNSRFDDLFERPKGMEKLFQFRLGVGTKPVRALIRATFSKFSSFYADPGIVRVNLDSNRDFTALIRTPRTYLWGYCEFYPVEHPYACFRPVKALQQKIDSYLIHEKTVGVHIRRGDHKMSGCYGTGAFLRAMEKEIRKDSSVQFFLATDNPGEELTLRQSFPGRILSHPKSDLNRNSRTAGPDAVVDLFCLSRCRKIIGSYYSSFSQVAWTIRGIEHEIAGDCEEAGLQT